MIDNQPKGRDTKVYIMECDREINHQRYMYPIRDTIATFLFDRRLRFKPPQLISNDILFHCEVGDYIAERDGHDVSIDRIVGFDNELLEVQIVYLSSLEEYNKMTRAVTTILSQVSPIFCGKGDA